MRDTRAKRALLEGVPNPIAASRATSNMDALPLEVRCDILTLVDPKTLLRSRRVSREWRACIDGSEGIWRSIAFQWKLINDPRSRLPICSALQDTSEDYTRWHDLATTSATGYFEGVATYKDLCQKHATLAMAWQTPDIFRRGKGRRTREEWRARNLLPSHARLARMDFLTPEWEDVDTQQPLILNTRTSGRISVMNTALDGSRTITEVSVLAALACDDPAEGKLQASNVLRKAPLPATAAEGRYFEHDGAYHFVLDLVERSGTHSIQVFRRIKDASYQLCRTIDPPSHFGVPACMSIRWPVGVVVTEVPPEGPETGWILFWNLETYKRFREVRLAHKTRAFEVDFDEEAGLVIIKNLKGAIIVSAIDGTTLSNSFCQPFDFEFDGPLRPFFPLPPCREEEEGLHASQIFVGTVYLSNNHDDVLHEQLHIDWRRVEGSAWNPSRVGRSTLEGYIKHISVIPDDEHFFKSSDNVHADIATDTLIVTYGWGLVLTRPYSKLKDRRFDCIKVAILHYCYVGERRSVGFTPIAPTLEVEQTAFGIGRLCQHATHRPPFSWMPLYHMIVIDLNAFRLDSMWTPKDHVFENVQAWLLETKGRPTSDSELSKDEERDPEAEDFFWHLWMDATTVYTIRTQSGLELVDFGLAVNPRPSPAAPDVSPKRQKQPARQARRR